MKVNSNNITLMSNSIHINGDVFIDSLLQLNTLDIKNDVYVANDLKIQNIKEDELRLFALKDVLIDYFNEVGQSDAALNRQYKSAGIYWGARIGITLDDKCVVTQVSAGSVAERLHIEPGDKVVRIGESENYVSNSCLSK